MSTATMSRTKQSGNVEPWLAGRTCRQPLSGVRYWGHALDTSGAARCGKPLFVIWTADSPTYEGRAGRQLYLECIDGHGETRVETQP